MSIKVTLGEAKTQSEKPFPKLMIGNEGIIIEVLEKPNSNGLCPVIIRFPEYLFCIEFSLIGGYENFTDYNEPITLQNK